MTWIDNVRRANRLRFSKMDPTLKKKLAAVAGRARWKGKTPEEISEHMRKAVMAREARRKTVDKPVVRGGAGDTI